MELISKELHQSFEKIRNWFKHQRKKEVLQGKKKFLVFFLSLSQSLNLYRKKIPFQRKISLFYQESSQRTPILLSKNTKNCKVLFLYLSNGYLIRAETLHCHIKHVKNWFSHRRKLTFHTRKSLNPNTQNPNSNQEHIYLKKEEESKINSLMNGMEGKEVPMNLLTMAQRIPPILQLNNMMLYMQNLCNVYGEILKRDEYMRIMDSLLKNQET